MWKVLIIIIGIAISPMSIAQNKTIRIFIDCEDCDENFLKRNLVWIDYVRNPDIADIHLWVTEQRTGSGNTEYNFKFEDPSVQDDSLTLITYYASAQSTDLEIQEDFVNIIRAALIPVLIRGGTIPDISVSHVKKEKADSTEKQEFWNYWVFNMEASIDLFREKSRNDFKFFWELEADRITEEWRFRSELDYNFEKNKVVNDQIDVISYLNQIRFQSSIVKSLTTHTSAGIFTQTFRNSVNNIDAGVGGSGAFEFNIFPYSQSHIREFTFAYYLGYRYFNYTEETIFNHLMEQKPVHQLVINYRLNQSWGGIDAELEGLQYLDRIKQKRLSMELDLFIRLIRGLSLNLAFEFQLVNDQIFLPKGDATFEDTLLRRRTLATDYIFEFKTGFSYTFGSLYNNIVNTRL